MIASLSCRFFLFAAAVVFISPISPFFSTVVVVVLLCADHWGGVVAVLLWFVVVWPWHKHTGKNKRMVMMSVSFLCPSRNTDQGVHGACPKKAEGKENRGEDHNTTILFWRWTANTAPYHIMRCCEDDITREQPEKRANTI